MANFQLYIKHGKDLIPLTVFKTGQTSILNAATYDESLKIQTNNYFELTFKIPYYIYQDHSVAQDKIAQGITNALSSEDYVVTKEKVVNPYFSSILHGTQLRLIDKNGIAWDSIVTEMQYEFNQQNIIISCTAIDIFSYQMSRRNLNYEISDSDNNIGALSLDDWAQKIKLECKINWSYSSVDSINRQLIEILAAQQGTTTAAQSFNDIKSFSVSGSNAYDALTKLAEAYGMQLKLNYEQESFGFVPIKKPLNRGFYLNPNINLKTLGIKTNGESQTTVLNVCGPKDSNGNEISLIPVIPESILSWFGSTKWYGDENHPATKYYSFDAGETINTSILSNYNLSNEDLSGNPADGTSYTFNNHCDLYGDYIMKTYNSDYKIDSQDYKTFSKMTEKESNFLSSITAVPYLENKLINIDYFVNTNLLTPSEYDDWWDLLYNQIRIANGRLMYETNRRLQQQSATISLDTKIACQLDMLNACVESSISAYMYDLNGSVSTVYQQLKSDLAFANLYKQTFDISGTNYFNLENYVTSYQAAWDSADQTFWDNIYEFKNAWEDKNVPSTLEYEILSSITQTFNSFSNCGSVALDPYSEIWNVYPLVENIQDYDSYQKIAEITVNNISSACSDTSFYNFSNNEFNALKIYYECADDKAFAVGIGEKIYPLGINLQSDSEYTACTISLLEKFKETSNDTISILFSGGISSQLKLKGITLLGTFNVASVKSCGDFYAATFNNFEPLIASKCKAIETNLTSYWHNAVIAGKNAGYWLPPEWNLNFLKDFTKTDTLRKIRIQYNYAFTSPQKGHELTGQRYYTQVTTANNIDTITYTSDKNKTKFSYSYTLSGINYYNISSDIALELANFSPRVTVSQPSTKFFFYSGFNQQTFTASPNVSYSVSKYFYARICDYMPITINSDGCYWNVNFIPDVSKLDDSNVGVDFNRPPLVNQTRLQKVYWTFNNKVNLGLHNSWINLYDCIKNDLDISYKDTMITVPEPCGISFNSEEYAKTAENMWGESISDETTPQWWFQPLTGFTQIRYIPVQITNYEPQIMNYSSIHCSYSWLIGADSGYENVHGLAAEQFNIFNKIVRKQKDDWRYEAVKNNQASLWLKMYTKYNNLIVENTYQNDSALTPSLLLKAAKNKFSELSSPEPDYSVSMLDVYNEDASIRSFIEISDQIKINTNETGYNIEYDEYEKSSKKAYSNKLEELLKKTLFISEISYSLRSDGDVSVTVNPVRYSDVMIDRLAKLL